MLEDLQHPRFNNERSLQLITELLGVFKKRRTTRHFSSEPVDIKIILNAIAIAGTAPSGANKQPWTFAVIEDATTKALLRDKSEKEEYEFYHKRAPRKWLEDLKPLHTNEKKEFITEAAYLIPVFFRNYESTHESEKSMNYYAKESVGLATGFLLASLHLAGLSTLTYTPSNRKFLINFLKRPKSENIFMVIAVGRPAKGAKVPVIKKKTLNQITATYQDINQLSINEKTNKPFSTEGIK